MLRGLVFWGGVLVWVAIVQAAVVGDTLSVCVLITLVMGVTVARPVGGWRWQ